MDKKKSNKTNNIKDIKDSNVEIKTKQQVREEKKQERIDKKIITKYDKDIKQREKKLSKLEEKAKSLEDKIKSLSKKTKGEYDFIFKIMTGLLGFSTLGLLMGYFVKGTTMTWMIGTFVFMLLFIGVFMFLIFLGKKTHAILEFKAFLTGKPISLFFTDHKSVEWKVEEPEGGILTDKKYGSFIINANGSYVDVKTKNVFMVFNPAIGSSAPIEAFKITDTLQTVIKDEKQLSSIRYLLMHGEMDGDTVVCEVNGKPHRLEEFAKLKENVNFSHLKSLMNTLIPHALNSKIEMTVQQRLGGAKNINVTQIILILVAIIGATTFAIMMLNIYGGGGHSTTTVIKEVGTTAVQNASQVIRG